MMPSVYLPPDEFTDGESLDFDLAADYLELKAFLSTDHQSLSNDIVSALDLGDSDIDRTSCDDLVAGAINRMKLRQDILVEAYPFAIDIDGDVISFIDGKSDYGKTAYLISLLLSNLRSLSPLIDCEELHPTEKEVAEFRKYFQYFATAAIAAEIQGPAWSFGFPRPDGTGFIQKLSEIWAVLKDGSVSPDPSSPAKPKDDGVDVFAWRKQSDGLPGFLLVAAQVATGKNWRDKSIKSNIDGIFQARWFSRWPVTEIVAYHVVPFACSDDDKFRDHVLLLGNILHRLRLPRRVSEAVLIKDDVKIEAFDQLDKAENLICSYLDRVRI